MKRLAIISLCMMAFATSQAQDSGVDSSARSYADFKKKAQKTYDDFRAECNRKYADFLEKTWGPQKVEKPKPKPIDKDVKPVILKDNIGPAPLPIKNEEAKLDKDKLKPIKPIVIEEIIVPPAPKPQPVPVSPIPEQDDEGEKIKVQFYGTACAMRLGEANKFKLGGTSEKQVAEAWRKLSTNDYNNVIRDCLEKRIDLNLCDWAYLQLLQNVAETFCGKGTDEATLLMAFLYCQSGYQMRLGEGDGRLMMLFSSEHVIYGIPYIEMEGKNWYPYNTNASSLRVSQASYPSEKTMSLVVGKEQLLGKKESKTRTMQSKYYPKMKVEITENEALMPFYTSYPTSSVGDSPLSRWVMYANTPINEATRNSLYTQLNERLDGKSDFEKVEMLLNFVQTSLVYEYDDKVWGGDRAFFPDETLYYPYADCEDRSILFTRLVRDLVGLRCALVYYPGHLAAAVELGEASRGDYLEIKGSRFTICDPTYINAGIGRTMPGMNNQSAKVAVL